MPSVSPRRTRLQASNEGASLDSVSAEAAAGHQVDGENVGGEQSPTNPFKEVLSDIEMPELPCVPPRCRLLEEASVVQPCKIAIKSYRPFAFLLPRDDNQPELELDSGRRDAKPLTLQEGKGYQDVADLFPNVIYEGHETEAAHLGADETATVSPDATEELQHLGLREGGSGEYLVSTNADDLDNIPIRESVHLFNDRGAMASYYEPKGAEPERDRVNFTGSQGACTTERSPAMEGDSRPGGFSGGINLVELSRCWPRHWCRNCLDAKCKCVGSKVVSREGGAARTESGIKRYPNWDPRSEYYKNKYRRCHGFEQGYRG